MDIAHECDWGCHSGYVFLVNEHFLDLEAEHIDDQLVEQLACSGFLQVLLQFEYHLLI